jgi:hypothetical protein
MATKGEINPKISIRSALPIYLEAVHIIKDRYQSQVNGSARELGWSRGSGKSRIKIGAELKV